MSNIYYGQPITLGGGGSKIAVISTLNEDDTQSIYIIDDGSIKSGENISVNTILENETQILYIDGNVVDMSYII